MGAVFAGMCSFLILSQYHLGYADILRVLGLNSNQQHEFEIIKIVRYGHDKAAFVLKPFLSFSYLAGQYVELSFGGLPSRPYSIASAPSSGNGLEIHMKDGGHGGVSTYAIHQAKVGDIVVGRGPMGTCVYDSTATDIVLLAGGIGITHLKAIAEEAAHQKHPHLVHLYWSVKDVEDLHLQSFFFTLKNNYNLLKYNEIIEDEISIGGAKLTEFKDLVGAVFYLSGPAAMIEFVVAKLLDLGVSERNIRSDMVDLVQRAIHRHKSSQ